MCQLTIYCWRTMSMPCNTTYQRYTKLYISCFIIPERTCRVHKSQDTHLHGVICRIQVDDIIVIWRPTHALCNYIRPLGCPSNKYGPDCSLTCRSTCLYGQCDPINGHCVAGCKSNEEGPFCEKGMCSNFIECINY